MTNEEMVVEIRAGRMGYDELWERVQEVVKTTARIFFKKYESLCIASGVVADDLVQMGYFALIQAVRYYDPNHDCSFLTFFKKYPLIHCFKIAARFREQDRSRNPLNNSNMCFRLEAPSKEDDELNPGAALYDTRAEKEFSSVIDKIYNEELHRALDTAMEILPERWASILRRHYWDGKELNEISQEMGICRNTIGTMKFNALKKMRRGWPRRLLQPFLDSEIEKAAWRGTGYQAWKNNCASSVERAAEKLDAIEKRAGL